MQLEKKQEGGILYLHLQGDLIGDQDNMLILDAANSALDQKIHNCAVDLSGVRYMNSSGLGVLITLMTKFRNRSGELVLIKPSEAITKLLIMTKLNSIFQIVDSEDQAKAFFDKIITQ